MKRIAAFILAIAALTACGGADRSEILKVYNWSCYIDESVIPEFEQWYEEQTGEKIKVIYQTFDINETMLAKIEKGHEDYDLVCPSDYIIERMLREDMLLPLDLDFGQTPNYVNQYLSPFIKDVFNTIDGNGRNANDYSICYMWGTTGLLYNPKYVSDEAAKSWEAIRNPEYKGKIFIKDAPRDVFAPVLIHLREKEIKEGKVTMQQLMFDSSDEAIADVENFMKDVKDLVAGWEADFGKEQMTQEKAWLSHNWSGDAVWAIDEAAAVGVELKWSVPEEGSTMWFDGWVIPKYAQNIKAAKYFINFMFRPDIAVRNVNEIGYVSANCSREILESQCDSSFAPIDLTYFFGEGAESVCANPVMYPDEATISRCALEHDWGQETAKLLAMWSRIKGENATHFTYVIILLAICALAVFAATRKVKSGRKRKTGFRKK